MNSLYSFQSQFLSLLSKDIPLEILSSSTSSVSLLILISSIKHYMVFFTLKKKNLYIFPSTSDCCSISFLILEQIFGNLSGILTISNDVPLPLLFKVNSIHLGFYSPLHQIPSCLSHQLFPHS